MHDSTIDKKEIGNGYTVCWGYDDDCESPRSNIWANVGHFYTWGRTFLSPDKNPYRSPDEFLECLVNDGFDQDELERRIECHDICDVRFADAGRERLQAKVGSTGTDALDWVDVEGWAYGHDKATLVELIAQSPSLMRLLSRAYVILPVFRLSHGSVAYSTTPFNDPWDSGQVGYIWASLVELEEWKWGEATVEVAKERFAEEVAEYGAWVMGDNYWIRLSKDGEVLEHWCGYIGDDGLEEGIKLMRQEAKRREEEAGRVCFWAD